jgi:hypothetical protein
MMRRRLGLIRCLFAEILAAAAGNFLLAGQGCLEHGCGAADAAVDADRPGGAVALAGAAFHAITGAYRDNFVTVHGKDRVRADIDTHAAAVTKIGIELERILIR